jgi:hypothetical protein
VGFSQPQTNITMKYKIIFAFIALMFAFACEKDSVVSVKGEADAIEYRASVTPVLYTDWKSGNAYFECEQIGDGCDWAWKVDDAAPNGMYYTNTDQYENTPTEFEAIITISNSDGFHFDWSISSGYVVCAVIVKGGPGANVFFYGGVSSDTDLYAPVNPNNDKNFEISHVSFCFKKVNDECYDDETAWVFGPRYVNKGNWATYTPYPTGDNKTVNIYAGQSMLAGTATFSAPLDGMVEITISLDDGFTFYYDLIDDNLKIQGYDKAPKGNPAPGLFAWKYTVPVGSTSKVIEVPYNNFYGIHLDVAYPVPCD